MTFKTYATKNAMTAGIRKAGLSGLKRGWEEVEGRYMPVMICELPDDVVTCNERGFKAKLESLPYAATLTEDWHGAPKGTELVVVGRYTDFQDTYILKCKRADGKDLPDLNGTYHTVEIAAKFVEMVR